MRRRQWISVLVMLVMLGCDDDPQTDTADTSPADSETDSGDTTTEPDLTAVERPDAPENDGVHGFAGACVTMDAAQFGSEDIRFAAADASGEAFTFSGESADGAAVFRMRTTDLATYLFYDSEGRYLTADAGVVGFTRPERLDSDVLLIDDTFRSPAEWILEPSGFDATRFQLRHYATDQLMSTTGLAADAADAAIVTLYPAEGCADFPELTLDAEGAPARTTWDDGDLWGTVETHGHLLTNFGFGGGGIFHGAPFHRLGVEHALASCETFHGEEGRKDVVGYAVGGGDVDEEALLTALLTGQTPDPNHATDGYPTFTDWPKSWASPTHQAMYYRWLERAWLSGLRLFVQHATGNSVLCDLITGQNVQQVRYSCNDMVSVDRQIEEAYNMQDYIDALHGGPGQGWFRIVSTPEEARAVIAEGKMAVILGIEISNLFDCFITPREGFDPCTPESVRAKLDDYYARGVRAIFPVHKYDNAFAPGDGHKGVIEAGDFINSGHWSNFTEDCPDVSSVFDRGSLTFGGINRPRDTYLSPAPNDMSNFPISPVGTLLRFAEDLQAGPTPGDWCQNATMTDLGEVLMLDLMRRGMIIEVDHLPRRAMIRAYELLVDNDYPAAATHGNEFGGLIDEIQGISKSGIGRCANPDNPSAMVSGILRRASEREAAGAYPAEGFGFDLNGFAGGPRPRFGPDSRCSTTQENPVTYPFTSLDGGVTFTQPFLGEREVDFNNEGMIHIGLLPELVEDARRGGATDEDLEPLYRSAEGYIRMWERAEARSAEIP